VLRFGFIVLLVWCLLRFVGQAEELLTSDRVAEPMDYTTVSAMGKLARVILIVTAALVIIQNLGYSIAGVLAFGGVGGIAVGFAAKDMLANFFGGAVVYMDKPFKVGSGSSPRTPALRGGGTYRVAYHAYPNLRVTPALCA